jgi:hypothetical protein
MGGAIGRARSIGTGTINATSTVGGAVTAIHKVAGNIAAAATVSGSVVALRKIAGSIAATSTVSGRVNKLAAIAGSIAAAATVSAEYRRWFYCCRLYPERQCYRNSQDQR